MKLVAQAAAGLVFLLAVLGAILFGIAGLAYWHGWAFLAVFASASIAITIDLARRISIRTPSVRSPSSYRSSHSRSAPVR